MNVHSASSLIQQFPDSVSLGYILTLSLLNIVCFSEPLHIVIMQCPFYSLQLIDQTRDRVHNLPHASHCTIEAMLSCQVHYQVHFDIGTNRPRDLGHSVPCILFLHRLITQMALKFFHIKMKRNTLWIRYAFVCRKIKNKILNYVY